MDITCPKCQARLQAPNGKKQALPTHCPFCGQAFARPKKKESVFRPENPSSAPSKPAAQVDEWEPKRKVEIAPPRSRRRWLIAAMLLVVLGTAALVAVPPLLPKDPREVVLQNYLKAMRNGDPQEARKWGVLEEMPKTSSNSRGRWLEGQDAVLTDSFAGISQFHTKIRGKYERQGKVFLLKDRTTTLARAINKREEMEKKAQEIFNPPPKSGQSESDRLFDMAENLARTYASLPDMFIGGPEHESLAVTYEQLLEHEGKDLTEPQRELLNAYREDPDKWNRLLDGSPFEDLDEAGPFTLERSTWEMKVWLPNQSSGEPPVNVRFGLVRFRVGLVDSGWKVWSYEVTP